MTGTAYQFAMCRACSAVAVEEPEQLCAECAGKRELVVLALAAPRFPRAAVALEAMGLAELCRGAASELDALAGDAGLHEPGTLRRRAHAVVRRLVIAVGDGVAL